MLCSKNVTDVENVSMGYLVQFSAATSGQLISRCPTAVYGLPQRVPCRVVVVPGVAESFRAARRWVREARDEAAALGLGQSIFRTRLDVCECVQPLRATVVTVMMH